MVDFKKRQILKFCLKIYVVHTKDEVLGYFEVSMYI